MFEFIAKSERVEAMMKIKSAKCSVIIMSVLVVFLLSGCAEKKLYQNESEAQFVNPCTVALTKTAEAVLDGETESLARSHAALEQLGSYVESLLEEGNREELEEHVISRTLTWDEAAAMAELSPAFAHFSNYWENSFDSDQVILVEADVNGDGLEDLIEYLMGVGEYGRFSLTIYENKGEQGYSVLYYHPRFDTIQMAYKYNRIAVIQYHGGIYLMFERNEHSYKVSKITMYQIQNGSLVGRLVMNYETIDVSCEVTLCKNGMEEWAKKLCEGAMDYYTAGIGSPLLVGGAEKMLDRESEEYAVLNRIAQEETEEYENKYQRCIYINAMELGPEIACQSDLDNDGTPELYARVHYYLGMWDRYMPMIYPTGELYGNGKHETEFGLVYSLGNNGRRTDFEQFCGLDIWSSDNIPQAFWVEQCGEENITFIKYYDQDYSACLIEGYYIQEGSYETVLSVHFCPVVSCNPIYEWREDGENKGALSYTVHLPKDKQVLYPNPVLYGLENEEIQNTINEAIAVLLQEKIDADLVLEEEWGGWEWTRAHCDVLTATNEKLILKYRYYKGGQGENICLEVNLKSGEVRILDYLLSDDNYRNKIEMGW